MNNMNLKEMKNFMEEVKQDNSKAKKSKKVAPTSIAESTSLH